LPDSAADGISKPYRTVSPTSSHSCSNRPSKTSTTSCAKDAGCTSELDYTEQTSWLLFLKYLDALEQDKATEAALQGKSYTPIMDEKYRWSTVGGPEGQGPTARSTTTTPRPATT
jgi:hypothetical protein